MEEIGLYLYPMGAPSSCTCAVRRNQAGEIVLPDLAACAYTVKAHETAIKRAVEILEKQPVKESQP